MTVLLNVSNLSKHYSARDGKGVVKAVNGISFSLAQGRTLGIVGESGCGKSTVARLILRLIAPTAGEVHFKGKNLMKLDAPSLRRMRQHIQIVFQDPYASLDPRMTVDSIISEPLDIHNVGTKTERQKSVLDLLDLVGLDRASARKYPHEFSGGQRQRISIARAIALKPELIVLDEPVSALDVSIQSQILNLLQDLKHELKLSYVFISHDLSIVEHVSDDVAVMYLGQIVEYGKAEDVLQSPLHPYTQALVSAIPGKNKGNRIVLAGDPPNPEKIPLGCSFHPRCHKVLERCLSVLPPVRTLGARAVCCHLDFGVVDR